MKVIPAIDIKDGCCVRLFKGQFDEVTEYPVQPAELATRYSDLGARWIHCVDLDGARTGRSGNLDLVIETASAVSCGLQAGGGVRDADTIARFLDVGVDRVVVGSVAVERPEEAIRWLQEVGKERIVLALDVQMDGSEGTPMLVARGWTAGSDTSLWDALDRFVRAGLRHVLCTDVSRDGAMTGPAVDLYAECVRRYPGVAFQASGGVKDTADLHALVDTGVSAAIVGRALLDGRISDEDLGPFLQGA
jgi:phosphoribosylformimino-5-aminoimidazole carboxamide ribotide isomerase